MKRINQLKEKRAEVLALADALAALADSEDRSLTDEEKTQFDEHLSAADKLADEIKQLEKLEEARAQLKPTRAVPTQQPEVQSVTTAIPANVYRHQKLRAFKGPDGELKAYRFGQFLAAAIYGHQGALARCHEIGIPLVTDQGHKLAMGESINTTGGAIVPEEFEQTIIDMREQYGVLRREARVWPMMRDTLIIPRRTGGLTVYFPGENPSSTITTSDKAFDSVQLVARKMATLTLYSSELAEDAIISIADDLASEIAYAFANKEDDCGFNGTGAAATYGGVFGATVKINDGNHAGSIHTAASGNTAFSTLDLADFHSVVGKCPLYARGNAKWYVSAAGFSDSMERLAYSGGGNTVSSIQGGTGLMFLGYPVVLSQVLNATLTADVSAIKLLFGDLRQAVALGSRRGTTVAVSDQRYFEMDQLAIRGTQRVDIVCHDLGDGTNAGPLIALKTPGS